MDLRWCACTFGTMTRLTVEPVQIRTTHRDSSRDKQRFVGRRLTCPGWRTVALGALAKRRLPKSDAKASQPTGPGKRFDDRVFAHIGPRQLLRTAGSGREEPRR